MTDLFERPPTDNSGRSRTAMRERRAAKKRKRRRQRNSAIVVVSLVAILVGGYFVVRNMDSFFGFENPTLQAKDYPGPGSGSVDVTVPERATGTEIGQILVEANVVQSVKAFVNAYNDNPGSMGIQPGTYTLMLEMKASDAVALLIQNEASDSSKLTIPEGRTMRQIIEKASSVTDIPIADFEAALADPASIGLPPEAIANGGVEGWLFPSTYTLDPDESAQSLLTEMVALMVQSLDSQGVAPEQRVDVLKKASMIQKEAPKGYFPEVASVIENRLVAGEALGIDAADSYIAGKPADDLTPEEFWTRRNAGLPPTAIANPGLEAIQAAIAPADTPWRWYVTVNLDTGETKFTDNYDEFNVFKAELKAWLNANPRDESTDAG